MCLKKLELWLEKRNLEVREVDAEWYKDFTLVKTATSKSTLRFCPECGRQLPEGFCPECGVKYKAYRTKSVCSGCFRRISQYDKHCVHCGTENTDRDGIECKSNDRFFDLYDKQLIFNKGEESDKGNGTEN